MKNTLIVIILFHAIFLFSQNYEYRFEESPVISWNGVNLYDASTLGVADISFFSSKPFSGIINPALIKADDELSFSTSFSFLAFDAFQYKGINEGVERVEEPLNGNLASFSSFATSFKISKFFINAGWYKTAVLRFPSFEFRNNYSEEQYDYYRGEFDGSKDSVFLAFASKINKRFKIGFKLSYFYGIRNIRMIDYSSYYYFIDNRWVLVNTYNDKYEENKIHYYETVLGFEYIFKNDFFLSVAVNFPLKGTVDRTVKDSFVNEYSNKKIELTGNGTDDYVRPKRFLIGLKKDFRLNPKSSSKRKILTIASEAQIILWKDYKYEYYGRIMERDMKNILKFALGIVYGKYSKKKDIILRAGFKLDPQPVKIVNMNLKSITCGAGMRLGRFKGDIALAYYFGNCNGILREDLIVLSTLTYFFGR